MRNCHIFNGGRGLTFCGVLPSLPVQFVAIQCLSSDLYNMLQCFLEQFSQMEWRHSDRSADSVCLGQTDQGSKRASAHYCGLTVRGHDPKRSTSFSELRFILLSQWSSTPARGDSNSINRNFNIYSLGGFPPIIYDDRRDVKGGHLFPLWIDPRGTKTFTCFPSQLGMYPKLWQKRVKLGVG